MIFPARADASPARLLRGWLLAVGIGVLGGQDPWALPPCRNVDRAQVPTAEPGISEIECSSNLGVFSGDLAAGAGATHRIHVPAGHFLRLRVEARGTNLRAELAGAAPLAAKACSCPTSSPAFLSLISGKQCAVDLRLRSRDRDSPAGGYSVTVLKCRPARAGDVLQVEADQLSAAALDLVLGCRPSSIREAIRKYQRVRGLWARLRNPAEESRAATSIGRLRTLLWELKEARFNIEQAVQAGRLAQDPGLLANALNGFADLNQSEGRYDQALACASEAMEASRAAHDGHGEAEALRIQGNVQSASGSNRAAVASFAEALRISEAIGDRAGTTAILRDSGYAYADLNQRNKALDLLDAALAHSRSIGDLYSEGAILTAQGHIHSMRGEKQKALDCYREAREILRGTGEPLVTASMLNGMGLVYLDMDDRTTAVECYQEALQIGRLLGNRQMQGHPILLLGGLYMAEGKYGRAEESLLEALAIFTEVQDRRMQAFPIRHLGRLHWLKGEHGQALKRFEEALRLNEASYNRRETALALAEIGDMLLGAGDAPGALSYYARALPIQRECQNVFGEASVLCSIARTEQARGNWELSRSRFEEGLQLIETLRTRVRASDLRMSYFASVQKEYESHIDLLMSMYRARNSEEFAAAALHAGERARARGLLDLLSDGRDEILQGLDPDLRNSERALRQSLNEREEQKARLLSSRHTPEELRKLSDELRELNDRYDSIQSEIRARSPRYAALTQPQPLDLRQIQEQVLDAETLLLEYTLGEKRSYLWAVTKSGLSSHELPARRIIEDLATRALGLLTARQSRPAGESARRREERVRQADAGFRALAGDLSGILLQPVASLLGERRLIVVADGALQRLPFGALPLPGPALTGGTEPAAAVSAGPGSTVPLIAAHEIISLPSASTLGILRRQTPVWKPPDRIVAVFADPVFDREDPRLPAAAKVRPAASTAFARLLSSRKEAEDILAISPGEGSVGWFGLDATLGRAQSEELRRYRLVHFATHGVTDDRNPNMSGVALSMFDSLGRTQKGFLRLQDIYNLSLRAELVVLSACETALGKELRGEGLIGLVRGFLYSGAARVVASLWKVDDASTAELMKRFYRGMMKEALSPAAALRRAQLEMSEHPHWSAPYHWAGFVLQGEPR